jgi:SAM-dependent methyltransferase
LARMGLTGTCAACEGTELEPHLKVAGELGPDGLVPTTTRFGTALADIVRCRRCGHMQLHPMPDEAILSQGYTDAASDDYVEEEAGQRETARRALERIEHYAPGRDALLDLGCWVGFLLAEARARGWGRTLGVEPSEFASSYARDRLGLEVVTAELLTAPVPQRTFDAVTMGDLIEHLRSPADALAQIRGLLVPGGVVWLALPDAGSRVARAMGKRWWSVIPTHVQYFTQGSLTRLLERSGFEPLEIRSAPKAFTVGYYIDRIGGYSPPVANALHRGASVAGVAERIWAPDFRDRMAVIARVRSAP